MGLNTIHTELAQTEVEFRLVRVELSKHDREYLQLSCLTEPVRGQLAKSQQRVNELDAKLKSSWEEIVRFSHQTNATTKVLDWAYGVGFRLGLLTLGKLLLTRLKSLLPNPATMQFLNFLSAYVMLDAFVNQPPQHPLAGDLGP